jgi:hypothetical protein
MSNGEVAYLIRPKSHAQPGPGAEDQLMTLQNLDQEMLPPPTSVALKKRSSLDLLPGKVHKAPSDHSRRKMSVAVPENSEFENPVFGEKNCVLEKSENFSKFDFNSSPVFRTAMSQPGIHGSEEAEFVFDHRKNLQL